MTTATVLALMFAVLLGLEWRYRLKSLRVIAVLLALVVFWLFGGPDYTIAGRRASAASPEERIRVLRGDTLSEYMSGVDIMREYLAESEKANDPPRRIALGALVWLGCAPLFRREATARQPTRDTYQLVRAAGRDVG